MHHSQADHESEAPEGHHLGRAEVVGGGVSVLGGEVLIRIEQLDHALLNVDNALYLGGEGVVRHECGDAGDLEELRGLFARLIQGA